MKTIIRAATPTRLAGGGLANWLRLPSVWFLLVWLGCGSLAWGQANTFVDYFAPSHWSLDADNSFNEGTFAFLDFTGPDEARTLQITSSANAAPSVTTVKMTYLGSQPGFLSFDCSLDANGNFGAPIAYCYVNNTASQLTAGSLTAISVPVGAVVAFELDGNVGVGKNPAVLRINPEASVPDSLGMVGMLPFVLLVAWHAVSRRQRCQTNA